MSRYIKTMIMNVFVLLQMSLYFTNGNAKENNESFPDSLFKYGFFNLAQYEYLKLLFNSPLSPDSIQKLANKVAISFLIRGEYADGIKWCEDIIESYNKINFCDLKLTKAVMLLKQGYYKIGYETIESIQDGGNSEIKSRKALLGGCSLAYQWKLSESIRQWSRIPNDNSLRPIADRYILLTKDAKKIKFLNPTFGSFLGIIPGLGYFYAGHYKTAISAVTVIGLTSWATVASFKNDVRGIGYLSGFLTVGWYVGNIYGSNKACKRANKYKKQSYLRNIKF